MVRKSENLSGLLSSLPVSQVVFYILERLTLPEGPVVKPVRNEG